MKICHVITDLDHGGAQEMLLKLLRRSRGHSCEVIALKDGGVHRPEIQSLDVRVASPGMSGIASGTGAVVRLRRLLRESRPDVVQTWLYHGDALGGIAAWREGLRRIVWNVRTGGRLALSTLKPATFALMKGCAWMSRRIPERIIVNSSQALEEHARHGYARERFELIPNGFELDRFRPDESARGWLRAELALPPEGFLVGLVARFHEQKDHALFLRAAARASGMEFVLVGPGVTRDNRALTDGLDSAVLSRCHLLGAREDIARITAALDVGCCVSAFGESFPNVLGEAMACAVPCVTTDVGDSARIVGDAGLVIPPGDAPALVAAWERLKSMSAAARAELGGRGPERVRREFSMEAVAARYTNLYETLMEMKVCAA